MSKSHGMDPPVAGILSYLHNALDAVDAFVLVCGADECFVACNKRFRDFFAEAAHLFTPGRNLREIMEGYHRAGGRVVPPGVGAAEFVETALGRVRGSIHEKPVLRWGDRSVRLTRFRTSDGGTICMAYDITEEQEIERELRARQRIAADMAALSYDWYWRQDADLRYVEFTGGIDRYVNRNSESWVGKRRWELNIEGVSDAEWAAHRALLAQRRPFTDFSYRIRTADGVRWFVASGKPLYAEDGTFVGYHGTGSDITERREAEEQLRASEARFRSLTELSTDWYWEQDDKLRFTYFSNGTSKLSAYSRHKAIGRLRWELPGMTPLSCSWEEHQALLAARKPFYDFVFRRMGEDGFVHYLSVSGTPIFDGDGRFRGYRGTGHDVTERTLAEQRMRESEERFRALTQMSSDWYWEQDEHFRFVRFSGDRRRTVVGIDDGYGKQRWELASIGVSDEQWAEHRRVLEAHEPFDDLEYRRVVQSGGFRWFSITGRPLFDEQKRFRGYHGVGRDVTARKEAEEQLRRSEERFRALARMSSDWYWEQDENFRFVQFSGDATIPGFHGSENYGRTRWDHPLLGISAAELEDHKRKLLAHEPFRDLEYGRALPGGEVRWITVSGEPLFDGEGRFRGYHGVGRDITARRHAEEKLRASEERFRALTALSSDWYWEQDEQFRFTRTSRLDLAGLTVILGKTRWELPLLDVTEAQWREHRERLEARQPFRDFRYRTLAADGHDRWFSITGEPVFDRQGRFSGYHGVGTDVTAQVEAEREIKRLAQFDFLTDLPNRTLFNDRLQQAITASSRHAQRFALLFIDLDRFRDVNNSLGHNAGDELLRELAQRFSHCLRSCDTVCRQGGDEFLVLLPLIDDATGAARLAKRLLAETARGFRLRDTELAITASIGIALFPEDGDDPATLIKNADAAMYHTKASGRNGFHFFTPAMHEQVASRLALERRLREAVNSRHMQLRFQPQMDLRTGAVTGAETVLHWRDEELGEVSPDRFLPLAEETRLIVPLGAWALQEACRQCRAWQPRDLPPVRVAVNVSAVQFQRQDFVRLVQDALNETRLAPSLLELEITEGVLLSDSGPVLQQLGALSHMGVQLALDEFGIGQSSLHHLKRFKVDRLKIDRAFVRDILDDATDASITAAIIRLGRTLGVRVLAVGVETEAQRSLLSQMGCHEAQGAVVSPAVGAEELAGLIRRGRMGTRSNEGL